MDLQSYILRKSLRDSAPTARNYCRSCKKPGSTCYCYRLKPFASQPAFFILMHPNEVGRAVATGRMAHLSLQNSKLWVGIDFSEHKELNDLLADPDYSVYLLFPDQTAIDIGKAGLAQTSLSSLNKKMAVIVLDGTWDEARSMKHRSRNLKSLPRICFEPPCASRFKHVRKQPAAHCFSTIESIHHIIKLCGHSDPSLADHMIDVFESMVQQQIDFAETVSRGRGPRSSRGPRERLFQNS